MITFIIPTLWEDTNIYSTIDSFKKIKDKDVKLFIINNTERWINSDPDERVIIFNIGFNSFVNPAWSFGVKKSTTEYVCCLNDDILIDLEFIHNYVKKTKVDFLGFDAKFNRGKTEQPIELINHLDKNKRPDGFGQFFLLKKKNWPKLPDNLKIFYGDDIIYYYHTLILGIQLKIIKGFKIGGNHSTSARNWWGSDININDQLEYFKWIKENALECMGIDPGYKRAWNKSDVKYKQQLEKEISLRIYNK